MQMIILAGGKGTRLGELTSNTPKSMIIIDGKPFLEYQIELIKKHNITDIILCTGHLHKHIERYFGDGSKFGVQIRYNTDDRLGTWGAIKNAKDLLDKTFFVMYGDSYLPIDYSDVEISFMASGFPAMMVVYKNEGKYDRSNVSYCNGKIVHYGYEADMTYIDYGLSVFSKKCVMYDYGRELKELVCSLVSMNKLKGYEVFERFYEIGSLSGLIEFEEYISKREEE